MSYSDILSYSLLAFTIWCAFQARHLHVLSRLTPEEMDEYLSQSAYQLPEVDE